MIFMPLASLTPEEVRIGKRFSVFDGLATESMTTLTGGTLLTAMAIYAGASTLQIGILAAIPSFTNIFQLLAIWLVFRFRNRKLVAVVSGVLARLPLLGIGFFPFLFSSGTSVQMMIFLLSFHYFFGSLAGPGWNSWMKDLVPAQELGRYFAHRGRLVQILSVTLGLGVGLLIDSVRTHYSHYEMYLYGLMFLVGGGFGLLGTFFLSKTPEPSMGLASESVFRLLKRPVQDGNFRNLLVFQGVWSFSLALVTPFYSVYLLKTVGLPLSYLIGLNLLTQMFSILAIRFWGKMSDRVGNKTIIFLCGPLYAFTILCWPLASLAVSKSGLLALLFFIHAATGISSSGVNLALGNIGLKMAERETAVAYIVVRGMLLALLSSAAPVLTGMVAGEENGFVVLFLISSVAAFFSLRLLIKVKESNEVTFGELLREAKPEFMMLFYRSLLVVPYVRRKWRRRFGQ